MKRSELTKANMRPRCPLCGASPGAPFSGDLVHTTVAHKTGCEVARFINAMLLWERAEAQ